MHEGFRAEYESYAHKVHFIFICRLINEPIKPLAEKDLDMLESIWIDIADISNMPLYPQILIANLDRILISDNVLYLGSERI